MDHINRVLKPRHVYHSPLSESMNPDLSYARPNRLQWFSVSRLDPPLNAIKLKPGCSASFLWKVPEVVSARAYEYERLHLRIIYVFIYFSSTRFSDL